jgi:hypothetical protein
MKQLSFFFTLIVLSISLLSCSDNPINTITFTNSAQADVSVNFRGTLTNVPVGATVELTNILDGEYEYETIYSIPAGATSYEAGDRMSGTLDMQAGTKVLVYYVSVLQDGNYSIDASVTSSNNLAEDGFLGNPISP